MGKLLRIFNEPIDGATNNLLLDNFVKPILGRDGLK